jgi:hypothetical protein
MNKVFLSCVLNAGWLLCGSGSGSQELERSPAAVVSQELDEAFAREIQPLASKMVRRVPRA